MSIFETSFTMLNKKIIVPHLKVKYHTLRYARWLIQVLAVRRNVGKRVYLNFLIHSFILIEQMCSRTCTNGLMHLLVMCVVQIAKHGSSPHFMEGPQPNV